MSILKPARMRSAPVRLTEVSHSPEKVARAAVAGAVRAVVESLESRFLMAAGDVLYRINAGGGAITSASGNWAADTSAAPSLFVNSGSQTYAQGSTIDMSGSSVPAGTPAALFQDERYDPAGGNEMIWQFPVAAGPKNVRLYFAEIFSGAGTVGARKFDVSIEGVTVLPGYDVFADAGAINKAVVKTFRVDSDTSLDIAFSRLIENPAIKAIEIIEAPAQQANTLSASNNAVAFGNVGVNTTSNSVLTLTNSGAAGDPSITISSATLSGANAASFTTNLSGNIVLAAGQSTLLTVSASPATLGAKSATLSINSSATNTPLLVSLTANAITPGVSFNKSTLQNLALANPTSLQWGPDGKLYVAQENGTIFALTIAKNGANNYSVTTKEAIDLVYKIPNHNDNGAVNASVLGRLVTGILVTGTAASPVIYLCSSDPRIGGGGTATDTNLDTNSGILSRLTKSGSTWVKQDLVRGLSRSEENHAENGLAISPDGNTIYIAVGGHTNMGAPSNNFAFLPEYALSAAILSVNLTYSVFTSGGTYDLPTLDDEDKPNVAGTIIDTADPFGGNDGKNQAKLVLGGPVQVYSPGYRNPYDILIASDGRMWTIDNGANAGWGDVPVGTGANATNQVSEPGITTPDRLVNVTAGKYGGHPNPTRANPNNKFNTSNPQSPVPVGNPIEGTYTADAPGVALATFSFSTNGLTEYTASTFGGAMKGDLLTASFGNTVYRLKLNIDGTVSASALFSSVGAVPLDVTAVGDDGVFPGTVWVCDWQNDNILIFEPSAISGTGADDPTLDDDGDKYNNHDEILNGTNPLNGADVPHDWDLDFTSDLLDTDDDNDALADTKDAFAIDATNGKSTGPRISYLWENEGVSAGKLLGLGFTGLMTNGTANYASLYSTTAITAGGAAGVLTIDSAGSGDALSATNTQTQGFQFGLNVTTATAPLSFHTRILGPFAGVTPKAGQSFGFYIGTGDQDNYLKLVCNGNGTMQLVREVAGVVTFFPSVNQSFTNIGAIDLYLTLDPASRQVQASYTTTTGSVTSPMVLMGIAQTIPAAWLGSSTQGLALGLISTVGSTGAALPVTWDFLETINPVIAPSIKINFQPAAAAVPVGYLVDSGSTYAVRGNGQTYGWSVSNTANVVDRNSNLSADQRYDTFAASQVTGIATKWEIALANGTYSVRIVAGDASTSKNATYKFNAEGVLTVNGSPTSAKRWVEGTQTVNITDGKLTITNASGASGNKINFIEITPVSVAPALPNVSVVATAPAAGEPSTNGAFTVTRTGATTASLTVTVALSGTATNGTDYNQILTTVTIPAGAASVVVPLTVKDDTLVETAETAILTVVAATGYTVSGAQASAAVTIADNDRTSTVPVLPGTLQAEDFDAGASGVAYFDVDSANRGGAYRTSAVDIVSIPTGGFAVGYTQASEWLAYTVDIAGGTYTIDVIAASGSSGGTLHFEVNGVDVSGAISITGTGGWDTYKTFSKSNVILPAGRNVVKFFLDSATTAGSDIANFDSFKFTLAAAANPAGTWSTGTSMPVALSEVASGVVGTTMYVVGEGSNLTLAHDLVGKTWRTNVPVRPFVGNHQSAQVINSKWYLFGGLGNGADGKVQIYNPATNAWTLGAAMPWAGGSVSSGLLSNGKVVVAGGIVGTTTVNNAAIYDPVANTWTNVASMPAGRNHAAAATDGGTRLFVFGGRVGPNEVANGFNTVQVYDSVTNIWLSSDTPGSTIAPLPQARGGMGTAVYRNGEFFVMGGETLNGAGATSNNVYNRVDIYSATANTWRLGTPMLTARHGISPVLYAGQIYVAGGGIKSGSSLSTILEIYSPDGA